MMNPQVKQLWIDALRSGKYQQGRQALRSYKDNYCCLGVLCDLYAQQTAGGAWTREGMSDIGNWYFHAPCSTYQAQVLPTTVAVWAGISSTGHFDRNKPDGSNCSLADENDSGQSFRDLAKIIEEHF